LVLSRKTRRFKTTDGDYTPAATKTIDCRGSYIRCLLYPDGSLRRCLILVSCQNGAVTAHGVKKQTRRRLNTVSRLVPKHSVFCRWL